MAKVDPVVAPGALDRAAVDGEHDRIALVQWHDRGPRLHTGTLFRQDELAAVEVLTGSDSSTATCSGKTCSP